MLYLYICLVLTWMQFYNLRDICRGIIDTYFNFPSTNGIGDPFDFCVCHLRRSPVYVDKQLLK
jgi:hypothetical protein